LYLATKVVTNLTGQDDRMLLLSPHISCGVITLTICCFNLFV